MLQLPSVTLACIDCEHPGLALAALEQTMLRCQFCDVVFFTDRVLPIEELRVIAIAPPVSAAQRLDFIAQQLPGHVRTPHVLLIQWDAFVVNPLAWEDAFLAFDFIAPISGQPAQRENGNDGIALMSMRLLRDLSRPVADGASRLADAVDALARTSVEGDPAVRIAPGSVRQRFAFADGPPSGQPFGFQGLYNMWMFFQPQDLDAFLQMATPDVLGSTALVSLGINFRDLGRNDEAQAVFAAILRAHPDHRLARSLSGARKPAPQPVAGPVRAAVGRNDPCPCGSGRKYKQCHGQIGSTSVLSAPGQMENREPVPADPAAAAFIAEGGIAVLFRRAQQAFERNDFPAAERLYREILARSPDDSAATEYLGIIATKQRRYDEAEALLTRAIELDPDAPENHNNLGLLLHSRAEFAPAIDAYRRALQIATDYAPAHNNLGIALQESDRLADAIESYRSAVRLAPDFAEAHWNLGLALILDGQYEEGLLEHEWRRKVVHQQSWWDKRRQFPEWKGEPLAGRRVLMLAEQGMGDMIHFVRYAADLAAKGATVVVEAAPELSDLLRTVPGVAEIVPRDGPYPPCDVQVPAMSLPHLLGTRPETVPAPQRYLSADPARIARWQQLLGARLRPRIGIAWAGNPEHARDRFRSIALSQFVPLLRMREFEWLALQKGPAIEQIVSLPPGLELRDLGKYSDTFADLAALIEVLDLVITVDTSVAHVAGALGRPALLLIDAGHDWRWPRAGSDSRWYPSMRLVRQPVRGDWAGAMRDAVLEVERFFVNALNPDQRGAAGD